MSQHEASSDDDDGIQTFKDPWKKPIQLHVEHIRRHTNAGHFSLVDRATMTPISRDDRGQDQKKEAPFEVAIKNIEVKKSHPTILREIYILRNLTIKFPHRYIVKLLFTQRRKYNINIMYKIVFPFMPKTLFELRAQLSHERNLLDIKLYIWQLFAGLDHLRKLRIMHRDVKPLNLLVEPQSGQLTIADFGSAIYLALDRRRPLADYAITRPYRPPEILMGTKRYNCMADVWSAGCVFIELFIGRTFFAAEDGASVLQLIYRNLGMPTRVDLIGMKVTKEDFVPALKPRVVWPMQKLSSKLNGFNDANVAAALFIRILQFNPDDRLHGCALLSDPFFQELFENGKKRKNGGLISAAISPRDRHLILGSEV